MYNEPPQTLDLGDEYQKGIIYPNPSANNSIQDITQDTMDNYDEGEGDIQHPYENLIKPQRQNNEKKEIKVVNQKPREPQIQHHKIPHQVERGFVEEEAKGIFDHQEQPQKVKNAHKKEPKKEFKASNTQKLPDHLEKSYSNRQDLRENKKGRAIKSATRGSSENSKSASTKIIGNSGISKGKHRSSSNKDRKQKSSPIRTTKISGKNQMGVTHYFTNKSKGERSKNRHTNQNSTYKEPIHQHANLLKAHNLNLSFNNYKTEMRLPNRQKFVADTQLVKSPFLSKTLKGMMQPKASTKNQSSKYGPLGYSFPTKSVRKKKDSSAPSSKPKRDGSKSNKKNGKGQNKLFNTKKFSFNNNGKQAQNLSDILSKNALNTSKIYSRNDNNIGFGSGGHFLTTGDGILDKRYSNRARQPKQTYYFNK